MFGTTTIFQQLTQVRLPQVYANTGCLQNQDQDQDLQNQDLQNQDLATTKPRSPTTEQRPTKPRLLLQNQVSYYKTKTYKHLTKQAKEVIKIESNVWVNLDT
jgi:hypothetical protein